jgi:hypothetical protein
MLYKEPNTHLKILLTRPYRSSRAIQDLCWFINYHSYHVRQFMTLTKQMKEDELLRLPNDDGNSDVEAMPEYVQEEYLPQGGRPILVMYEWDVSIANVIK